MLATNAVPITYGLSAQVVSLLRPRDDRCARCNNDAPGDVLIAAALHSPDLSGTDIVVGWADAVTRGLADPRLLLHFEGLIAGIADTRPEWFRVWANSLYEVMSLWPGNDPWSSIRLAEPSDHPLYDDDGRGLVVLGHDDVMFRNGRLFGRCDMNVDLDVFGAPGSAPEVMVGPHLSHGAATLLAAARRGADDLASALTAIERTVNASVADPQSRTTRTTGAVLAHLVVSALTHALARHAWYDPRPGIAQNILERWAAHADRRGSDPTFRSDRVETRTPFTPADYARITRPGGRGSAEILDQAQTDLWP